MGIKSDKKHDSNRRFFVRSGNRVYYFNTKPNGYFELPPNSNPKIEVSGERSKTLVIKGNCSKTSQSKTYRLVCGTTANAKKYRDEFQKHYPLPKVEHANVPGAAPRSR